MRAAFRPMPMPIRSPLVNLGNTRLKNSADIPTRLTTNQLSPATAIFRICVHNQRSAPPPLGPPRAECTVLLRRIRLFLSMIESCIQSVKTPRREEKVSVSGYCDGLARTKKNQPIVVKSSYFLYLCVRGPAGSKGAFCAHWISDVSSGPFWDGSFV